MPGETLDDALSAARVLRDGGLGTVFTYLGENVTDENEAHEVTRHYLEVLRRVREMGLGTEISVKLTHLGLDVSPDLCYENLKRLIEREDPQKVVWIDMESSGYVDRTLDLYRAARRAFPNVGVCVQAYLLRTAKDLDSLIALGSAVRLVKGAYLEPPDRAFRRKKDVDENFLALGRRLLSDEARRSGVRAAIATHDRKLIRRLIEYAKSQKLSKERLEFQMLYGIQRAEQFRLAREGFRSIALIAYGNYWFPWFMRRLAERPANALFVVRNLFSR
jgi:proline dehydrogenase